MTCNFIRKTTLFVGSMLVLAIGFSNAYAEDAKPEVVSQGGPLGATSIGQQNIQVSNSSTSPSASSSNQPTGSDNNASDGAVDQQALLLQLQKQVKELKGQLSDLKNQQSVGINYNKAQQGNPVGVVTGASNSTGSASTGDNSAFSTYSSKVEQNNSQGIGIGNSDIDMADILAGANEDSSIVSLGAAPSLFNEGGGIDVSGAPAITTGGQITYLGSYSGNNSIPIGMISSNLFASTLLGQRAKFDDYSVFFGGFIEADAQVWFGDQISRPAPAQPFAGNGQNIYLTNSKLYFLSNLGHYVTAQFDFDADETGNFHVGNAFVIFGNLDTSNWFVTAGKNKLSVGSYGGGGPLTGGVTDNLFGPGYVTNLSVNYKNNVFNANVAVFGADDQRANFSTGLFYADAFTENLSGGFNVGYIYNIAGANNGSFGALMGNDQTGAVNIDANLTYAIGSGFFTSSAGWAGTTSQYDYMQNGTQNYAGAWYVSGAYALNLGGRDTNFNLSYGQTYNAAGLPMAIAASPLKFGVAETAIQYQFIASAQRAYFDNNVLFGPEYAYQKLYNGQHMNTITLDMSVYI
ncbi:DUF3573 domain-containing protein [Francisella frigiditurris]|uniref:DUF3573 domain-containing protein n=1 Tax=Francisella frigiditurris TaxID=1542390 RepID=A0A1J0KVW5_9GAMM|nr:DUF3573 domain-containing protein [Francisella frigiditurris]APC97742.1 hypothetical protein KX01_16 [Francisella frigiditurris]